MKNIEKTFLVASRTFLGVLSLVVIISCSKSLASADSKGKDAIPVQVSQIHNEHISIPLSISGNVSASRESRLSFKTGGIIKDIRVHEGDQVVKGQLLAQLDLKEINQQVLQARVGLEKAQRDFVRVENLYNDTVSTLKQLQDATSALDLARASLNIAEYNLKYSSIYAPANGIILRKFMEEDEITGTGTPVFYFASAEDAWKLTVGITDKNIVKLKLGDKAKMVTDAYPETSIEARISKIANAPEPGTGLYEVELALEPSGLNFKPGFFARGQLFPSQQVNCQRIPVDAVREGTGDKISFFLFDANKGVAVEQEARVLYLQNEYVYLRSHEHFASQQVITAVPKDIKHLDAVKVVNVLASNSATHN